MDLMRQKPRWVDGRWQRFRLKRMRIAYRSSAPKRARLHLPPTDERPSRQAERRTVRLSAGGLVFAL